MLTKPQAEELIKPLKEGITACHEAALKQFNEVQGMSQRLYKRSKTTLFHNLLNNHIKDFFQATPSVRLVEKYESIMFVVGQNVELIGRFKKLNDKGLPSNIRTKRNMLISSNQFSLFEDMVTPTHLVIGYRVDASWTAFEEIKILCLNGDNVIWHFNIDTISTTAIVKSIAANDEATITNIQTEVQVKAKGA